MTKKLHLSRGNMPLSLNIPESTHAGFEQLLAVEGEHLRELEQALSEVRPALDRANFASIIVDRTHIDKKTASEMMRVLISLYALRSSQNVELSEFVENIADALKATGKDNLKPRDNDWQSFREKLRNLLSYDQTVGVTAKAQDVMTEHQRVFVAGASRIVTDVRMIFSHDDAELPKAAVVVHTLKLGYIENDDALQFFLALDSDDLRHLKLMIERAEHKEQTLKAILDKADVEYLSLD